MLNRYEIDLLQNAKKILREAEEWRASIGEKSSIGFIMPLSNFLTLRLHVTKSQKS